MATTNPSRLLHLSTLPNTTNAHAYRCELGSLRHSWIPLILSNCSSLMGNSERLQALFPQCFYFKARRYTKYLTAPKLFSKTTQMGRFSLCKVNDPLSLLSRLFYNLLSLSYIYIFPSDEQLSHRELL